MLQLGVKLGFECLLRSISGVQNSPDGATAIAVLGPWTDGIAGLKGKVWLDAMHRREVVVLDLA